MGGTKKGRMVPIDLISQFMNEGWPKPIKDWYFDDQGPGFEEHTDEANGYSPLVPGTLVDLDDFEAAVCYQGDGDDPSPRGNGYSLVGLFKAWQKSLAFETWVVTVPRDKTEVVMAAVQYAGGVVASRS